jgi:stalled ribosome alternative rescue factor ArfA
MCNIAPIAMGKVRKLPNPNKRQKSVKMTFCTSLPQTPENLHRRRIESAKKGKTPIIGYALDCEKAKTFHKPSPKGPTNAKRPRR